MIRTKQGAARWGGWTQSREAEGSSVSNLV